MKNIFLFCFALLVLSGCKKQEIPSYPVRGAFDINYKTTGGINLLDPATPNAITRHDIEVYVMKNNVKTRIYNENRMSVFLILEKASNSIMRINLPTTSNYIKDNTITFFIKAKDIEDKFVMEFINPYGSFSLNKIYVNDKLKCDNEDCYRAGVLIERQ